MKGRRGLQRAKKEDCYLCCFLEVRWRGDISIVLGWREVELNCGDPEMDESVMLEFWRGISAVCLFFLFMNENNCGTCE